jgi:N-acetylglucosamine kinase-like BadF-type ATPase
VTSHAPVLAVDGGQSSIRARLLARKRIEFEQEFPPLLTDAPLMPQLAGVVRSVLTAYPRENVRLAAALSGLTSANADALGVMAACGDLGLTSIRIAHDSISGYLGCAAGTGVVTLATGPTGSTRVDGWGNIMGDAGSGYWIGRAGLDAAMRAHDGRGDPTALLGILKQDFPDVEGAYIEIQSNPEKISFVASYARKVIDLSEHDTVSARIVEHATNELALSVGASLRNTGWTSDSSPTISWVGKILSNTRMAQPLQHKLQQAWPNANIVAPHGGPLDGVAQLADLPTQHALYPLLHTA